MTNLIPRDTSLFHDVADFRRNFDQLFNRLARWPSTQQEQNYANEFSPAIESFIDRDSKKFHCEVLLPGIDPKNVDIHPGTGQHLNDYRRAHQFARNQRS